MLKLKAIISILRGHPTIYRVRFEGKPPAVWDKPNVKTFATDYVPWKRRTA